MADSATISQETKERVEKIGGAELVVGFVSRIKDQQTLDAAIGNARAALGGFAQTPRTVLVHPAELLNGPGEKSPAESGGIRILPIAGLAGDALAPLYGLVDAFRSVFAISRNLNARACTVIPSDLAAITPEWIEHLTSPALEGDFDLVTPCYVRHHFEGLINRGILYPLVRALYGRRVRNPLGPDFCVSARLIERILPADGRAVRAHPVVSLVPEAIASGFRICQSHLGARVYPAPDAGGLSALLAQVLDPLFAEVERRAAFLQRVRGSQPVEEFGSAVYVPENEAAVDVSRLLESFQIGARNLREIWSTALPPSTLVELNRLSRAPAASFHMADELWARIVYDFALAHRLRSINRDHLLRALTPLYLGWVASYALGLSGPGTEAAEQKVEQLCLAYENARPYFVARWRWPDRFNP